jgi:cytochrome c oxidase cbb3-type subunit IV
MDMLDFNINQLRALVTVISFVTFGGIVAWALSKRNKSAFDEAAMLPFTAEPETMQETPPTAHNKEI